jgi:hypothetical protein
LSSMIGKFGTTEPLFKAAIRCRHQPAESVAIRIVRLDKDCPAGRRQNNVPIARRQVERQRPSRNRICTTLVHGYSATRRKTRVASFWKCIFITTIINFVHVQALFVRHRYPEKSAALLCNSRSVTGLRDSIRSAIAGTTVQWLRCGGLSRRREGRPGEDARGDDRERRPANYRPRSPSWTIDV